MSQWTDAVVAAALALPTPAGEAASYTAIETDTRTLREGALFVALRGLSHDAHAYLADAASRGARGAVVEHVPDGAPELRYYVVPDTLAALGRLARCHRRRLGVRVCAVVGSNGKTTTKDLLRAVLATRYRVHATTGNFNNLVGVPLTLLSCPRGVEVIVAEAGTNVPGEVARLAGILEPDAVVITTIAAEHLEGLGDLDGVLREETSILPWLPAGGVAAVPDEPEVLPARARALVDIVRVVGFSDRANAGFRGADLRLDEAARVQFGWAGREVRLQLRGRHNARNALLALAIGRAWAVDDAAAVAALADVVPPKMRAEIRQYGNVTVITDCYNANPASVRAAMDLLVSMPRRGGRVAVLGSMLELGPTAPALHEEVARDVAAQDVDRIVATGEFARAFEPLAASLGDRLVREEDPLVAWERAEQTFSGDEVILLKGSRGVALERLLPRFIELWGELHPHGEAIGPRASRPGAHIRASTEEHPHTSSTTGG